MVDERIYVSVLDGISLSHDGMEFNFEQNQKLASKGGTAIGTVIRNNNNHNNYDSTGSVGMSLDRFQIQDTLKSTYQYNRAMGIHGSHGNHGSHHRAASYSGGPRSPPPTTPNLLRTESLTLGPEIQTPARTRHYHTQSSPMFKSVSDTKARANRKRRKHILTLQKSTRRFSSTPSASAQLNLASLRLELGRLRGLLKDDDRSVEVDASTGDKDIRTFGGAGSIGSGSGSLGTAASSKIGVSNRILKTRELAFLSRERQKNRRIELEKENESLKVQINQFKEENLLLKWQIQMLTSNSNEAGVLEALQSINPDSF